MMKKLDLCMLATSALLSLHCCLAHISAPSPSPSSLSSISPAGSQISAAPSVSATVPSSSPAGGPSCTDLMLNDVSSCLSFLMEGAGEISTPGAECCQGYEIAAQINPDCICAAIQNPAAYSIVFNVTRVLAMPTLCHFDALTLDCISEAPAPSPDAGAYTPSESPAMPSTPVLPGSSAPSQSPAMPSTLPGSSARAPSQSPSPSPAATPLPGNSAPFQSPSPATPLAPLPGSSAPSHSPPLPSDDGSSSPSPSPAGSSDCKGLLMNGMLSCTTFLTEGQTMISAPDDMCCEGYKTVAKTVPDCICAAIEHRVEYNLVFNMTRVLAMPTLCNYAPPPLHCILPEAPVPSSGADDTPPELPAAPLQPQTSNIAPPPPPPATAAAAQAAPADDKKHHSGAYTLSPTFAVASVLLLSSSPVFALLA